MEYGVFITLGVSGLNCLLTAWQSVKMNHFKSTCAEGKCCLIEDDLEVQSTIKKEEDIIHISETL